jgi:hypothetical protein
MLNNVERKRKNSKMISAQSPYQSISSTRTITINRHIHVNLCNCHRSFRPREIVGRVGLSRKDCLPVDVGHTRLSVVLVNSVDDSIATTLSYVHISRWWTAILKYSLVCLLRCLIESLDYGQDVQKPVDDLLKGSFR